MSDTDHTFNANAGLSATVTGEITVAAVIILFILFAVALILYLRAKGYSGTVGSFTPHSGRLNFSANPPNILKQALDLSILKSLPITVYRSEEFKEEGGLECAVCLAELRDGETARLLPKCKHGFHVECIDMWFHSNSTCPLCRNPVGVINNIKSLAEIPPQVTELVSQSQNSISNLDEGSSSTGSEKRRNGMLVIEIPRRAVEGFPSSSNTPMNSSRIPAEGIKSPGFDRLRSLRRILSRGSLNGNCAAGSSCSPRGSDIEQGIAMGSASYL